jgi:hypothetical protein
MVPRLGALPVIDGYGALIRGVLALMQRILVSPGTPSSLEPPFPIVARFKTERLEVDLAQSSTSRKPSFATIKPCT